MSLENPISISDLQMGDVAILGVPHDKNSSFMRGPAQAPAEIRRVMHAGSANLCTERGRDLGAQPNLHDVGDISFANSADDFAHITAVVDEVLKTGARLLTLGGDHAITFPIMRAVAQHFRPLTIVQIDAHPDLYDELDGNRLSHACPFARIMEAGLVDRLIQIGVRTLNPHQREQAARFGVEIIEMKDWTADALPAINTPVYLSLDLDGLDPAFAPGVSHHEPGGFTTRQVLDLIQNFPAQIIGADVVELNPTRDPIWMTAMVAAKLAKEIAEKMLEGVEGRETG